MREVDVDVAVVCFQRVDFAAMQMQRVTSDSDLSELVLQHSESLVEAIRAERVVLSISAGVSVAAGVGDFANFVSSLKAAAGVVNGGGGHSAGYPNGSHSCFARRGEDWVKAEVAKLVSRSRSAGNHGPDPNFVDFDH